MTKSRPSECGHCGSTKVESEMTPDGLVWICQECGEYA